mmetsp:Transcript_61374/g.121488  ORF Transcript_61374/g.121488 Transcript_61374/m.121488 type:complete len:107 (-) Transcript_61374:139-459(-)
MFCVPLLRISFRSSFHFGLIMRLTQRRQVSVVENLWNTHFRMDFVHSLEMALDAQRTVCLPVERATVISGGIFAEISQFVNGLLLETFCAVADLLLASLKGTGTEV